MSILITGAGGFIGSHLTQFLLEKGHKLILLDRLDSTVTLSRLASIPNWTSYLKLKQVELVWWDLKAEINDPTAHKLKDVHTVIHLAAESHVDRSIKDPLLFTLDNVVGTCNLLNWIVNYHPRRSLVLLHISTDEVFGSTMTGDGFTETDPLFPTNPYSATKAGAEALVTAFACTYGIPSKILRMTNVIGHGQHPEKFIPTVIRLLQAGGIVPIHSDASGLISSKRMYLDVKDVLAAIQLLIDTPNASISKEKPLQGIYHISGEAEYDNSLVAERIAMLMNKKLKYVLLPFAESRPNHDMTYRISCYRMKELGWTPKISLDESLKEIVEWYRKNPEWWLEF